ncbi:MAG: hypothetical protein PSX37_09740, partial [bacterium]|nr:hypothetical protein [bacterium]
MTTEPIEFDERLSEGEHPASTADELVVHGLIESRARDTEASQSRRVASAIDAIRTPSPLRLADRFRGMRIFAAAASLLLVLGLMSMLFTSTAQTADALVNSSIARAVDAGPRRYSLMVAAEQNTEPVEVGTLDLAPPGRMLLKTKTPENDELVVGRNETGEWAVRRDGAVDRAEPRRSWPGWLHLADDALIASPEEVLEVLARDYDLRIEAGDRIGGRPQRMVVGTAKSGGPSRRPSEVQVFLDERTLTVTRMELRWSADAIQGARDRINRAASVSEDPSSDGSNDGPRGRPDGPPGDRDGPGPDGREPRPRPRMPHGPLGGPMGDPRGGPPMGDGEPHP